MKGFCQNPNKNYGSPRNPQENDPNPIYLQLNWLSSPFKGSMDPSREIQLTLLEASRRC
jgi:hypothetical protein